MVRPWLGLQVAQLAEELAAFLVALREVPAADGPPAGPVTAYRGTPLTHYADEALSAFRSLDPVTATLAEEVFHSVVTTRWEREPVWFHGDFAADNVLIRHGRWHAVLDFGGAGVGDPACDLVIAFTWLDHAGRHSVPTCRRPGRRNLAPRTGLGPVEGGDHTAGQCSPPPAQARSSAVRSPPSSTISPLSAETVDMSLATRNA